MFDTIRNKTRHLTSKSNSHSVRIGLLPRDIEVEDLTRVSEASEDTQPNHKPPRLRPSLCLARWKPQQLPIAQIRTTDPHFVNRIGEQRSLHGLCLNCTKNFSTSKLLGGSRLPFIWAAERFLLHESVYDFHTAVQSGCHFCNLAWQEMALDQGSIPLNFRPSKISVRIIRFDEDTVVFELSYNGRVPGSHSFWGGQRIGDWFLFTSGHPYAPKTLLKTHISHEFYSTDSTEHLKLATSWLDECSKKHIQCRPPEAQALPSRLLFVGDGDACIHLTETPTCDQNIRYCALTHCWGGALDILKLEHHNYHQLHHRIILQDLPKTFQDAAKITRGVGVAYLWIDSLCIIQDSQIDWDREASKMGAIYEQAALTIVASNARNAHEGCFTVSNPLVSKHCRLAANEKQTIWVGGSSVAPLTEPHVYSRAWVQQERLLSHRKIFFENSRIRWHCKAGTADQYNPLGVINQRKGGDSTISGAEIFGTNALSYIDTVKRQECSRDLESLMQLRDNDFDALMQLNPGPALEGKMLWQFHSTWNTLVTNYSRRKLTRAEDRLIAFSGLVSRVQRQTGLTYFAGLWKETLLLDLCWERVDFKLTRRSSTYCAPSWSWASLNCEISAEHRIYHFAAYMASFEIASIKHRVIEGRASESVAEGSSITLTGKLRQMTIDLSYALQSDLPRHGLRLHYNGEDVGILTPDSISDVQGPSRIFLMPLIRSWDRTEFWNSKKSCLDYHISKESVFGIALSCVGHSGEDTVFGRIGYFESLCFAGPDLDALRSCFDLPNRRLEII